MSVALNGPRQLRPDLYRTDAPDLWHVADHEAIHAATLASLDWEITGAEVSRHSDGWRGHVSYSAPVARSKDCLLREELVCTVAPSGLGAPRSAGDSRDGWNIAATIAGNGETCMALKRDVRRVLDEAYGQALALAERPEFDRVRREVRQALGDRALTGEQTLLGHDIAEIILGKPLPKMPKGASAKRATASRQKPAPGDRKFKNACRSCGYAYTPQHASGRCRGCRPAILAAQSAQAGTPMRVTFPALPGR